MAYEINPRLPHLHMKAVRMVQVGYGVRKVARHFGYTPGAVSKWVARARDLHSNAHIIPTRSSRPYHHPHELSYEVVRRILQIREERNQCAEIVHHRLGMEGVDGVGVKYANLTFNRFHVNIYHSKLRQFHYQ